MKFLRYLLLAAFVAAPVALQAKKDKGGSGGVVGVAAGVVGKVAGFLSSIF